MLFLILLSLISASSSQSCQKFAGSPSICEGLFSSPIWVPPGYTQTNLSETLINSGTNAVVLLPKPCAQLAIVIACSSAFRICGTDGLPLPLCPDYCEEANLVCSGLTSFNCNQVDPIFADQPLWIDETNRTGTEQDCRIGNATNPSINCPYPFIENPLEDKCTLKCPPTGIDDKHTNDALWTILRVFAPIAIVVEIIILPGLWGNWKAKSDQQYIFFLWICFLGSSICDIFGKWLSWEDYICQDKWTVRTQSSTICGISVIGPQMLRDASVTLVCAIMYLIICRFKGFQRFRLFGPSGYFSNISEPLVLHFFIWAPPGISLIISYSKHWVTAEGGPFTCYTTTNTLSGWAANMLTSLALTITAAISTFLMGIVATYIIKNGYQIALQQWRVLFLCLFYTIVVWIVLSFSWATFAQRHAITEAVTKFLECVAFTGSQDLCPPLNNPINTNLQLVSMALSTSVPIIIGVPFILNRQVLDFWRQFLVSFYLSNPNIDRSTSAMDFTQTSQSNRL